ncbi:hypothetical protein FXO37_35450 [Capsicum annuum]|nr:hypothetical protein FXO37_35450 [Capsicum annuum]
MEVNSFSYDVEAFGKIVMNSVLEAAVAESLLVAQRSVTCLLMVQAYGAYFPCSFSDIRLGSYSSNFCVVSLREFFAFQTGCLLKDGAPLLEFITPDRSLENPIPVPLQKFPFLRHDDSHRIFISQSCNGLLLCRTFHNPFMFNESYYIINPTTQQFTTLPKPSSGDVVGMSLAFDPLKSPYYKVICLQISEIEPANYQIEIYSSELKKWRVSGPPFPRDYDISFNYGLVYWNGAIYISCNQCFNVEQEKFEKVPILEVQEDHRIVYFGESYGHLHLIQVNRHNLALYNIYEMNHDGTGWFLKYEVNVEDVVLAFPHMIRRYLETTDFHYYAMNVLNVVRGEKEEDTLILHIPEKALLRYNLVDKSFYKLCDFDTGIHAEESDDEQLAVCLDFGRSSTYQYIESTYCW